MSELIQTLQNDTFYPTPTKLISKMLEDVNFDIISTILEPSAGNGDLVATCIAKATRYNKLDIDCIEIDLDLQHVLKSKDYRLVHDDFLTYNTQKQYDLIIANFPFNEGAKHLLKALQMQSNGGGIIAIVNAETLKNLYTNERKTLMELLNSHGATIQYLKDEFVSSERKTSVEIALVKILIEKPEQPSFIFENLKKAQEAEQKQYQETNVAFSDFIQAAVAQCNLETTAGLQLIDEYNALLPHMMDEVETPERKYSNPILELKIRHNNDSTMRNGYVKAIRRKYWKWLFQNPKFTKKLTSNLQAELQSKVNDLQNFEFSEFNILEVQAEIFKNVKQGVEDTIIELFDKLSSQHSWYPESAKNIHYYNGWKTNKAHKIGNKVILPINGFSSSNWSGKTTYEFKTYNIQQTFEDMLKAIDYLLGETESERQPVARILDAIGKNGNFKNVEFEYFTVDFFKKGTAHIKFKEQTVVDKLNIFGARHKNWLPPSYGKKAYKDMNSEEKTVVDDFQGETEYKKVLANPQIYLYNAPKMMMIE